MKAFIRDMAITLPFWLAVCYAMNVLMFGR